MRNIRYRKTYILISIFIGLITLSLIIALFFGFKFTQKVIETRFFNDKIEVLDEAIKPYNDLLFNRIPQISLYQGFLDSISIYDYTEGFFDRYPFLKTVTFYDVEISNRPIQDGFKVDRFSVGVKAIYRLGKQIPSDSVLVFKRNEYGDFTVKNADFSRTVIKFVEYIAGRESDAVLTNDEVFHVFYTISPNSISYLNVPRDAELRIYTQLMTMDLPPSPYYEQDLLTFQLDPFLLKVTNHQPELYQEILVKPVVFDSLSTDNKYLTTGIALPGAFSEYQLYFISSRDHVNAWVLRLFRPVAFGILAVYFLLLLISYLIFRTLNVNSKLFKLQYDFINNLTHEFKTPVSVIKIAGNNLRSATKLSEEERNLYGKILDEEADKLNDMMNKLLSLTQLENKSIILKKELIDLHKFCSDIIDAYRLKHPDFKVSCIIEKGGHYEGDVVLLTSIFQNLMDNAYKYSYPNKKELMIRISKFRKYLVIKFTDQGIGVPARELTNIFKKFYRVENEFNQQGSAGIGLAFCKEIINFMKGEIKVKSRVGKGSEFRVLLPLT